MKGKSTWLPERNVWNVRPIRWKILVQLERDEYKGRLVIPDTKKDGDTTKQLIVGRICGTGELVHTMGKEKGVCFDPGTRVILHPSLDIMSPQRCFRDGNEHYMLCDCADIEAVVAEEGTNEEAKEIVEAN